MVTGLLQINCNKTIQNKLSSFIVTNWSMKLVWCKLKCFLSSIYVVMLCGVYLFSFDTLEYINGSRFRSNLFTCPNHLCSHKNTIFTFFSRTQVLIGLRCVLNPFKLTKFEFWVHHFNSEFLTVTLASNSLRLNLSASVCSLRSASPICSWKSHFH